MKIKIEDTVPLPEDWQSRTTCRGNLGWPKTLRDMKINQSFELKIHEDKKEEVNDINNLRQAIYKIKSDKYAPRNYIMRLMDKSEYANVGMVMTYRVWAAPMAIEMDKKKASA